MPCVFFPSLPPRTCITFSVEKINKSIPVGNFQGPLQISPYPRKALDRGGNLPLDSLITHWLQGPAPHPYVTVFLPAHCWFFIHTENL